MPVTALSGLAPLLLAAAAPPLQTGSQPADGERDLTELSLEELMNVEVEVVSASRHAQPLARTPAAIFVLTAEDIRRSGATSLPEVLRLVPGVTVARLDANRWAVSVRGFADEFANKLLVLVDGRSAYTPLFSGVHWDVVDVPLDDIERIEVVRGPGGTMWGVNAVNGVINVITKSAHATHGTHATSVVAGDERTGYVRHGGAFEAGSWRAWASYVAHDESGSDGGDAWSRVHAGVRLDLAPSERDAWMVSAEAYGARIDNEFLLAQPTPPFQFTGSHHSDATGAVLHSRWTRTLGEGSELALQASLEHSERELEAFAEERTTADVDFQHRLPLGDAHDFLWGVAARGWYVETPDTFLITWDDGARTSSRLSAFVQDEFELVPDRWTVTAGTKVEHDDRAGIALQPSVRVLHTPDEHQSFWAAASRAVRTPSEIEREISVLQAFVPGAPDQQFVLFGDRDVDPETLDALELGYRARPAASVAVDLALFYNRYEDLILYEPGAPFASGGDVIVPFTAENRTSADSYGFELALEWLPRADTRIDASWSMQELQVDSHGSASPTAREAERRQPENHYRLGLRRDLAPDLAADVMLAYVDRLPEFDIDATWRLDALLEYRPDAQRSFAIGVRNVFHDDEAEFGPGFLNPSNEVETALFLRLSWSF